MCKLVQVYISIDPEETAEHKPEERSAGAYTKATWRARFCDCRVRPVIT